MKRETFLFIAELFCTLFGIVAGFILLFISFECTSLELDTRKIFVCIAFALFFVSILTPELFYSLRKK